MLYLRAGFIPCPLAFAITYYCTFGAALFLDQAIHKQMQQDIQGILPVDAVNRAFGFGYHGNPKRKSCSAFGTCDAAVSNLDTRSRGCQGSARASGCGQTFREVADSSGLVIRTR